MTKLALVREQDMGGTSLPAPKLPEDAPLLPFEERQLKNLLQQVAAAPPRVRAAFYEHSKHLA